MAFSHKKIAASSGFECLVTAVQTVQNHQHSDTVPRGNPGQKDANMTFSTHNYDQLLVVRDHPDISAGRSPDSQILT